MTTIVQNGIQVDGVDLNSWAYNVSARTGRYDFASPRLPLVPVPNRQGQVVSGAVKQDPGIVVLDMWVRGTDETGAIPIVSGDEGRDWNIQFEKNMDILHQLFGKQYGSLRVQQRKYDGSLRECYAYVNSSVKADISSARAVAQLTWELLLPDVWWQDTTDVSSTVNFTNALSSYLPSFLGATAPMETLKLLVRGTITNPRITDVLSGNWVQYSGTVSNQDLYIDVSTYKAYLNSLNAGFVTTGTDVTGSITHGGNSRLFSLSPAVPVPALPTAPLVTTTGSSPTGQPTLIVQGRRRFHS